MFSFTYKWHHNDIKKQFLSRILLKLNEKQVSYNSIMIKFIIIKWGNKKLKLVIYLWLKSLHTQSGVILLKSKSIELMIYCLFNYAISIEISSIRVDSFHSPTQCDLRLRLSSAPLIIPVINSTIKERINFCLLLLVNGL